MMRHGSRAFRGVVLALVCLAAPAFAQSPPQSGLSQAFQHVQLSPQQLMSLREFLGQFGRDANVVSVIGTDGANAFELRDPATNERLGEIAVRQNADGSIWAARVVGDAEIDATHALQLPLLVVAKNRNEIAAALAASAVGAGDPANGFTDAPFLASQKISSIVPAPQFAGTAVAAEGVFFADGSGYITSLRGVANPSPPKAATDAPPLHVSSRFFTKIESDGARLFRASVIDIVADGRAALADTQAKLVCAAPDRCGAAWTGFVRPLIDGTHVMRRAKAGVQGPPELIARLLPQPVQPVSVDDPQIILNPPAAAARPSGG